MSIENYKKQIAELQNIIAESQNDLAMQKQLLTESMDNLKATETQYNELLITFENLNKQYQSSLKTGRLKNKVIIGLGAGLAASIIINVLQ